MLLSQKTQAALHQLWEAFSSDGVPPHLAIQQVSFLILLKLLDERTETGPLEMLRWSSLKAFTGEACLEHVCGPLSAWLRESVWARTMPVLAQATFTISKVHVLESIMGLIDDLFAPSYPPEHHAAIYDALAACAEEAAAVWARPSGQFLTPMHIARLLCDLVQPQPGEAIADLACGSGRLLLAAYQHVQRTQDQSGDRCLFCPDGSMRAPLLSCESYKSEEGALRLFGVDRDARVAMQAWMSLFCAGVLAPDIHVADTLSSGFQQRLEAHGPFDAIVANPPYGSVVDQAELADSLRGLGASHAEALFLELIMQVLRPGGRAAVIVPDGLLYGQKRAYIALRRRLLSTCTVHAVVSLPEGTFLPYTGVKTSVVLFSREGSTTDVWFYQVQKEGTDLSAKKTPRPEATDVPDLLVKYGLRSGRRNESAFVTDDTWFCWENVDPTRLSEHYTRPLTVNRYVLDEDGCPTKIAVCHGAMAVPLDAPKDWSVAVSELDMGANLVASRYAPFTFPAQRNASLPFAKETWDEDDMLPERSAGGLYRKMWRGRQDALTGAFRLPESQDEAGWQAWFDQGVSTLIGLYEEGSLSRTDVRQLIELLLAVQRTQQEEAGCGLHAAHEGTGPPDTTDATGRAIPAGCFLERNRSI